MSPALLACLPGAKGPAWRFRVSAPGAWIEIKHSPYGNGERVMPDLEGEHMSPTPRFIHGVFAYEGRGLEVPSGLGDKASYVVPSDRRAQMVYVRAGNSGVELINLLLLRDGKLIRYFPVGAQASIHVPLAVVEEMFPESKLELQLAAPAKSSGSLIVDIGLIELD
jgi:hypothetical protein